MNINTLSSTLFSILYSFFIKENFEFSTGSVSCGHLCISFHFFYFVFENELLNSIRNCYSICWWQFHFSPLSLNPPKGFLSLPRNDRKKGTYSLKSSQKVPRWFLAARCSTNGERMWSGKGLWTQLGVYRDTMCQRMEGIKVHLMQRPDMWVRKTLNGGSVVKISCSTTYYHQLCDWKAHHQTLGSQHLGRDRRNTEIILPYQETMEITSGCLPLMGSVLGRSYCLQTWWRESSAFLFSCLTPSFFPIVLEGYRNKCIFYFNFFFFEHCSVTLSVLQKVWCIMTLKFFLNHYSSCFPIAYDMDQFILA